MPILCTLDITWWEWHFTFGNFLSKMGSSSVLVRVLQRSKTNRMYLDLYLYINIAIDRVENPGRYNIAFQGERSSVGWILSCCEISLLFYSVLQLIEESPSALWRAICYIQSPLLVMCSSASNLGFLCFCCLTTISVLMLNMQYIIYMEL